MMSLAGSGSIRLAFIDWDRLLTINCEHACPILVGGLVGRWPSIFIEVLSVVVVFVIYKRGAILLRLTGISLA